MASLDHMEGDLLEGTVWVILGIIVLALVLGYLGQKDLLNFLKNIEKKIAAWLKKLLTLSPGSGAFNPSGHGSGPSVKNGDPRGLQIPLDPMELFDVNQLAHDIGGGDDASQASSVGVSFGGPWYESPAGYQ